MRYIIMDLEMNRIADRYRMERQVCKMEVIEIGAVVLNEAYQEIGSFKTLVKPRYNDVIEKKYEKLVEEIVSLAPEKKIIKKEEKAELKVGDNVRIKDNEQIGVITSLNTGQASVSIRGLTVKVKVDDLTLMPKIKKQETKVTSQKYRRMPSEINLVGQRVEDGLVMVEEYLDKANASHMSSVKVIHGIGTGALRKAIRQRLTRLSYVKSFHDGDYYDGGSAVTIVEFK